MSAESAESTTERRSAIRRLSGQDAVFVYGETPSSPMHTIGTMILDPSRLDGDFGYDEIVATLQSRIHLLPPFRQRLLTIPLGLGHPMLVDDPDFELENHVHRIAVPEPGTMRELAPIVADIAARLLDRSQPLWEMWVIEGMENGQIALVTKLHHCMIDGASGSSQMAQLMDLDPDAPPPVESSQWDPDPLPTAFDLASKSLGSQLVNPLSLGRLVFDTAKGLRNRSAAWDAIIEESEQTPADGVPETGFNRALTTHRSVAWGSAPLADVKRIKNAFGVTVNDVVMAACALSLRSYLGARDDLPAEPLGVLVPVSTKSETEKSELFNKVSMMRVELPTQLEDPEGILSAVHRASEDAKRAFNAVEDDLIPQWLELLSPLLITALAQIYTGLKLADYQSPFANLVISNMIGPPVPLYFGGARVAAVYPMGPVGEGLGLNLTVLSNMGRVDLGVLACRELVDDAQDIADGFGQAIAEMLVAAEKKLATE